MTESINARSYAGTRDLLSFLGKVGLGLVVLGIFLAVYGFFAAGDAAGWRNSASVPLLAAVPGLGIALAGLFSAAFAKVGESAVDVAELTRQHHARLRGGVTPPAPMGSASPKPMAPAAGPAPAARKAAAPAPAAVPPSPPSPVAAPQTDAAKAERAKALNASYMPRLNHDLVELYRQVRIWRDGRQFLVGSFTFPSHEAAREFIAGQLDGAPAGKT